MDGTMKTIEKYLDKKGMTKVDLQKATGLHKRTIESIRYHDPGFSKMVKIADALDISLDEFR
ncbi:helix-turn-helix transcriptional regulator [Streptococcus uberis]|uniref:helix-turn-helix domain-containing protein n=1 Tax=Streptococcus uberis TaxID=1349 RepID=UPI0022B8DBAF|nr:helix-turn-helix transcriptional regulator [Streptococcus uberis]MCZ8466418.1 helix-turn-helix transcriptional regulator [Streptococcus uberis]